MQKEFAASIEQMNKTSVDAMKRLGEIQLRSMERFAEQQLAITSSVLDQGVKQMRTLADTKDVSSVLESQTAYFTDLNAQAMDNAKATADILATTKSELTEWVEAGVKAASETPLGKAVASAAPKKKTSA
jgi:phasin family protein